ncbi:hypothetical protein P9139_01030 [Curtobacterium flaccumfaciens]|nr:hypothetical protein P9139_01030 [Curtobacterium flaccumfaciens]
MVPRPGTVPEDFGTTPGTTAELLVDLGFTKRHPGFQAEGLAWRPDGSTIKGVEPKNDTVPIEVGPGESFELYVEAAANPDIGGDTFQGATPLGSRSTAGTKPIYKLRALEIVERDDTVWELQQDFWVLRGLMAELPPTVPAVRTCSACSNARPTPSTRTTSPAPPRTPERSSHRHSPSPPAPPRTGPSPSVTPTSTPPGSGRSARRSASALARSRTCST